jgi:hypothetical protein
MGGEKRTFTSNDNNLRHALPLLLELVHTTIHFVRQKTYHRLVRIIHDTPRRPQHPTRRRRRRDASSDQLLYVLQLNARYDLGPLRIRPGCPPREWDNADIGHRCVARGGVVQDVGGLDE